MNDAPWSTAVLPILLPLLSAIVYVAGALLIKRATELGAGTWRITWICNLTAAAVFAPLALFGGAIPPWHLLWQPAVAALLFILGQIFTFRALHAGDVSVATPVLGLKIIFVALFTTVLLRETLTPLLWASAILSSVAIALLNATRGSPHRRVGFTIVLSSLAAMAYALFDICVQRWSFGWEFGRFLPVMMGFVALFSLPMRSLAKHGASSPTSGPWLAGGAICFALQSVMFVSSIALFREATVANVLYSSRGLWSVMAVWLVGHWFANYERALGPRILAWRLSGAALLMTAIVLVVLGR